MHGTRFIELFFEHGSVQCSLFIEPGSLNLVHWTWFIEPGSSNLVHRTWFIEPGSSNLVHRTWFIEHCSSNIVHAWNMIHRIVLRTWFGSMFTVHRVENIYTCTQFSTSSSRTVCQLSIEKYIQKVLRFPVPGIEPGLFPTSSNDLTTRLPGRVNRWRLNLILRHQITIIMFSNFRS